MHEVNPYVQYLKHGIELMRAQGGTDVRMIIRADGVPDPRRYNAPTAPEVAVIMPGDGYFRRRSQQRHSATCRYRGFTAYNRV